MEFVSFKATLWLVFFVLSVEFVSAEDGCYGAGFVATSVVLSVLITLLVVGAVYYWSRRRPKSEHLILETDPEKGKAEYAFDNPGFKDATLLAKSHERTPARNEPEKIGKQKWNNWPGISALTVKTDKRKTVDDSSLREQEIKVVTLKSQDFAGLGFNICGNMKEGIYIKDILHRGPASESGKLNTGDRIVSVTIDFEHIVYEDALNILSFASPYEITVEAKGGKISFGSSSKSDHPRHPIYRSTSSLHLQEVSKMSRKRLYTENSSDSNHSTLHKSLSNTTTLERKDSTSPRPNHIRVNEHLKSQLEQKISSAETEMRLKSEPMIVKEEIQKTENRHQKFGIKVFPTELQKSPKAAETSQNDNNINIEKRVHSGIDEVDQITANKDHKAEHVITLGEEFNRNDSVYGSGLKRDANGIPQEIPSHMLNAAVAARRNRKSQDEILFSEEDAKILRKIKGKAPAPPGTRESVESVHLKDIDITIVTPFDSSSSISVQLDENPSQINDDQLKPNKLKRFSSDSEDETDKHSSVNTIELNSCDITIHQVENEEKQNRKTASTGDLTKIQKTRKSSTGTLERAQSLEMSDSVIPNLAQKRKGGTSEDIFDMNSDEDFSAKAMLNKEPRLSLILDGLNTFQRNRLKKSTEWGNLEDAILGNRDDDNISVISDVNQSSENLNGTVESAELNAVVNKINEIKMETQASGRVEIEGTKMGDIINTVGMGSQDSTESQKPKNQLWPTETETSIDLQPVNPIILRTKTTNVFTPVIEIKHKMNVQNKIWPEELKESNERRLQISDNTSNSECDTSMPITVITKTNLNEKEYEKNALPNSLPKTVTETPEYIKENLYEQKIISNINNKDPVMEIANSIAIDDVMIVSETPPDAITELETMDYPSNEINNITISSLSLNSNTKSIEIIPNKPNMSNKIKTHKRQQIPHEENEIPLPPENSEPEIEKEMFAEFNNGASVSKISEIASESTNSKLSASPKSQSSEEQPQMEEHSFLAFERNSETGELCTTINNTDESKTLNDGSDGTPGYLNNTESFIYNEKYINSQEPSYMLPGDTNISDDIKVSRHSFGSLERPKSDDAKSIESIKYSSNVSNVTVNNNIHTENGSSNLHSLELSVNDSSVEAINESELYTTALNQSLKNEGETSKISLSTPDLIKNVTIAEAMNTFNGDMEQGITFGKLSNTEEKQAITINSINDSEVIDIAKLNSETTPGKHSSLTYITEIQVTPSSTKTNVSEIEILPQENIASMQRDSENIENHIDKYEVKDSDTRKETRAKYEINSKIDPEIVLHKIHEIAQEQFKKLPEMRFSTSSYENSGKSVEKRRSQVELLKSNFEKSPPKSLKTDLSRSRIPVSTTMKTPPTTPERDSNTSAENEKELFESMSYSVHSTPMTNTSKFQKATNNKNITVTSIRTNSRIPSGLPIVSGIRPPVPPKRTDQDNDSLSSTNSSISSFKQWVFNPVNSVTNISSPGNHDSK